MTIKQTINHEFTWPGQHYPVWSGMHAENAVTALCWDDVSTVKGPWNIQITKPCGKSHIFTAKDHTLHVIECLMRRPIKCASIPRIGEYVRVLRHEYDVHIHCERYQGNAFGAYHLIDRAERVAEVLAA